MKNCEIIEFLVSFYPLFLSALITDKYCIICGTPTNTVHHLVFGRGKRNLADVIQLV